MIDLAFSLILAFLIYKLIWSMWDVVHEEDDSLDDDYE